MNNEHISEKPEKIIVFEEICFFSLPFLFWHLIRNHRITVIRYGAQFRRLLKKSFSSGQIEIVDWNKIDYQVRHRVDIEAIKLLQQWYDPWFDQSGLRRLINTLYGTADAEMALRKNIVLQLKNVAKIRLIFDHLAKKDNRKKEFYFIPASSFNTFSGIDELIDNNTCRMPWYIGFYHFLTYNALKMKNIILLLVHPFWTMTRIGIPSFRAPRETEYRVGIRIYDTDLSFIQKYRSIDFLVGETKVTPAETLFLIETPISEPYRRQLKEKRYHTLDVRTVLQNSSLVSLKGHVITFMKYWFLGMAYSLFEKPASIRTFLESLDTHVLWTMILDRVTISHYVVYNDTSPSHIFRNILLRKHGVTTWYYVHSCGTPNYFSGIDDPELPHVIFTYLYYDRFVTWNPKVQKYYAAHPIAIRKFESFGCLWSDAIFRISSSLKDQNDKLRMLMKWTGTADSVPQGKILAVFDSTFGGDATLTVEYMVCFIRGILGLLHSYPFITILFKMKYSSFEMDSLHPKTNEPDVQNMYNELKLHPRCILLDETNSESAEVIAVSDLVISACFTSPTVEALGAGKKGIYFDADGKARNTYYDQFPRIVAHNENELYIYVDYWLNRISEREFNNYVNQYIINEISWQVDGKAVERFRIALTPETH
jgi:polysaccharide biosynthesis PFTS motif protein